MPIINREKIEFPQSSGATHWIREVHVSSSGWFSIKLPPDVQVALKQDEVRAETKKDVLAKWDKAIRSFSQSKAKTKRVIVYEFGAAGFFDRKKSGGRFTGFGMRDRRGLAIALHAEVYDEIKTMNGDGKWVYRYESVESSIPGSMCFPYGAPAKDERRCRDTLDWTAEREIFFAKMGLAMESIIEDFEAVFREDGRLEAIADSGGVFLIAPTDQRSAAS